MTHTEYVERRKTKDERREVGSGIKTGQTLGEGIRRRNERWGTMEIMGMWGEGEGEEERKEREKEQRTSNETTGHNRRNDGKQP
jgi:hypothetical protein